MPREVDDPLGHLRQGLQWQADKDQQSAEEAVYARLAEFDAPGAIKRFRATGPPAEAAGKLDALLEKLVEAIRANLGRPPFRANLGRQLSRWELEALQELRRFAGETSVEQPRPVERAPPSPARPTPPRPIKPPLVKRSLPSPMKRLPQPPTAMTASEAGRMGGTEAQKHRREADELAWTADALQIAKDARAADPHITTKAIGVRIWGKLRGKNCPPPDEEGNPSRQVYRFIEKHEAIEDGIPRRVPYKDKKAVRRRAR